MKVQRIGLAVLVALVGSLAVVAAAQAAEFTAESYPVTVTGNQGGAEAPPLPPGTGGAEVEPETIFGFEGKLMTECGFAGFVGQLSAASSSLTVSPTLSGCYAFGFIGATVSMNGCEYRFNATSGSADAFGGTMDIVCPTGKKITVVGGNCEVQIGAQTGLTGISYANLTEAEPKAAATVGFGVKGFTYTKTKDGLICPLAGTGTLADGVIVGGATVLATDSEANPIGFGLK